MRSGRLAGESAIACCRRRCERFECCGTDRRSRRCRQRRPAWRAAAHRDWSGCGRHRSAPGHRPGRPHLDLPVARERLLPAACSRAQWVATQSVRGAPCRLTAGRDRSPHTQRAHLPARPALGLPSTRTGSSSPGAVTRNSRPSTFGMRTTTAAPLSQPGGRRNVTGPGAAPVPPRTACRCSSYVLPAAMTILSLGSSATSSSNAFSKMDSPSCVPRLDPSLRLMTMCSVFIARKAQDVPKPVEQQPRQARARGILHGIARKLYERDVRIANRLALQFRPPRYFVGIVRRFQGQRHITGQQSQHGGAVRHAPTDLAIPCSAVAGVFAHDATWRTPGDQLIQTGLRDLAAIAEIAWSISTDVRKAGVLVLIPQA